MKYRFDFTSSFKREYKKFIKIHDASEVDSVIEKLLNGEILEAKYRDHALTGNYKGCRECHIRPDVLLIYRITEDILLLTALHLDSHSNLFR